MSPGTASTSFWRDIVPSLGLLCVTTAAMFAMAFRPLIGRDQYAVVAPVWYSRSQTAGMIGAAGGSIVDFGGWTNIVIAQSPSPTFVRALYRAGALLVVDPLQLRGCTATDTQGTWRRRDV